MKFSVITITRNNLPGLKATFESVVSQSCRDYEFTIVDGASSDDTPDFLKQHDKQIDFWVSEPDSGIYNAMNKGISHAHGEYLIFMNSGDVFHDKNVLADVWHELNGIPMLFGQSIRFDGSIHKAVPNVQFKCFWGFSFPHQASFISADLFQKYGNYREDYRCASDMFFFFEMIFLHHVPYKVISRVISDVEPGGISAGTIGRRERRHYILHHMPFLWKVYGVVLEIYSAVRNRFFPGFSISGHLKRSTETGNLKLNSQ